MNREIKFRQYSNGEFHYWGYIKDSFTSPLVASFGEIFKSQQYTGLLDKNGKEIYEGDIIEFKRQDGVWGDQIGIKEVKYPFICGNSYLGEIIGNIYENPNLLKS